MTLYGVFGAGGCGRGISPLVRTMLHPGDQLVFVDDGHAGETVNRLSVLSFDDFADHRGSTAICLAVADPQAREALDRRCAAVGLRYFSVAAQQHVEMDDVQIGEGALISPFTSLTSNIRIGRHFHLNLYSYVEHDCVIGDFVTFAPAVRCNGGVTIGDGAYVGSNAVIRQGLSVGAGAVIGMGAVVTKDVPAGETWVGNPARALRSRSG
jgi:sugar O-acyltransferase (sialic acid O-acetyltransferase NeuD family)